MAKLIGKMARVKKKMSEEKNAKKEQKRKKKKAGQQHAQEEDNKQVAADKQHQEEDNRWVDVVHGKESKCAKRNKEENKAAHGKKTEEEKEKRRERDRVWRENRKKAGTMPKEPHEKHYVESKRSTKRGEKNMIGGMP